MGTSSIQPKKTHSGRRPASVNFLESIARSLGPLLRRVSKEQGAFCYRDPLGGPCWLLPLSDQHVCEVQVVSQPDLHLEITGFWIDSANHRVIKPTPLRIPLDQNGKEVRGSRLYIYMFVMFGRLLGMSRRARQAAADS